MMMTIIMAIQFQWECIKALIYRIRERERDKHNYYLEARACDGYYYFIIIVMHQESSSW